MGSSKLELTKGREGKREKENCNIMNKIACVIFLTICTLVLSGRIGDRRKLDKNQIENTKVIRPVDPQNTQNDNQGRRVEGRKYKVDTNNSEPSKKYILVERMKNKLRKNADKREKTEKKDVKVAQRKSKGSVRATVNDTCLATTMSHLKLAKDKVANFLTQFSRMQKFNKTGDKKLGKKGLFAPIANKLIDVAGGNSSDVKCGGTKSAGASTIATILGTLKDCETSIKDACKPEAYPLPENMTKVVACETTMKSYQAKIKACLKKSGSAACDCFEDSTFVSMMDDVKACDLKNDNAKVTTAHKLCVKNFSSCKSAEDNAGNYVYACAQTAVNLKKKAAQTMANLENVVAAKTKAEELASNSSRMVQHRSKRADAITDCATFIATNTELIKAGQESTVSAIVSLLAKQLANYSGSACSDAEKTAITSQVTEMTMIVVFVNSTLDNFKATVGANDGSVPTTEELTAIQANVTAEAAAAAPASGPSATPAPASVPASGTTEGPASAPASGPTEAPASAPTSGPTEAPASAPASGPTEAPASAPASGPTEAPASAPASGPTEAPASGPTEAPASGPTDAPSPAATTIPVVAQATTLALADATAPATAEAPVSAPTSASSSTSAPQ